MIREKKFREELETFLSKFNSEGYSHNLIDEFVTKVYPPKKKKVAKYFFLGDINCKKEEWEQDPSGVAFQNFGYDMPNFNQDEDGNCNGKEGQKVFARVNGDLYSFTIWKGECIEASWDGSIWSIAFEDVTLIPKEEESNHNLVQFDWLKH
jgi:hypothetical protein